MDKEIRLRGHTNVIVFAYSAHQAFLQSLDLEEEQGVSTTAAQKQPGFDTQMDVKKGTQQESTAGRSASAGIKTVKGKVMLVLKQIQKQVWWLTYAENILKIEMKNRAETKPVGMEKEKAAISKIVNAEPKLDSLGFEEKLVLKTAVRLAVGRTLEERISNKKVTVSRCVSAYTLK